MAQLSRKLENWNSLSKIKEIQQAGIYVNDSAVNIPVELKAFLYTLLTGNTEIPIEYPQQVQRLINSFRQNIYGVSGGRQKPPSKYCYHMRLNP